MKQIKKYFKEDNYIHYANCHEDFLMLRKYLQPGAKNILSVASGLDNSLSFLTEDGVHVDAFDFNPSQIYLGQLKIEGIRHLTYDEYLILAGLNEGNPLEYYEKIKGFLPDGAREYFDGHQFLVEMGLIHIGRFEYYFRLFSGRIFPLVLSKKRIRQFSEITSLDEQIEFYKKYVDTWRFRFMFSIFFSKRVMAKTGRDKAYFKYSEGGLADLLKKRTDIGFMNHPNGLNPYYSYVLANTYKALPYYLEKENFLKIQKNISNISLHEKKLDDVLTESYDFMNLSDVFEYMSDDVMEDYSAKIRNALNLGGRIAFWNMMNVRTMPHMNRINTEEDLIPDRAFFYRDFLVYELN